jgi:hypothetical protein
MKYTFNENGVNDFIKAMEKDPDLRKSTISSLRGTLTEFKTFVRDTFELTDYQDRLLDKFTEESASKYGNHIASLIEENAKLEAFFGDPEPGTDINIPVECGFRLTHLTGCTWQSEFYYACHFNLSPE